MSKFKALSTKTPVAGMPSSIITRDAIKYADQTGNIYQSLNIIAARARQISDNLKVELNEKLGDFATQIDNLEEVHENREQIEISKFFERLPKPSIIALEEFGAHKVFFRKKETDGDEPTPAVIAPTPTKR
jgi:DNA-directed RNA polymerase subunit K/omega